MSRARRIWKWTAISAGGLLVVMAVALGAFRIWLEHSPELAPSIVARVEKLTGLDFQFARLDARLGLYGPEFVFREARIYVPGQHDPLVTAAAGRVGFDWWRFARTGRLASGRVMLDGARVYLFVTDDGVELRGQGDFGLDSTAKLRLDQLPVGHVVIDDATVTVQDLRTKAPPVRLERVDVDLVRNPRSLAVAGDARLPAALGDRVAFQADLDGDLAALDTVRWRGRVALRDAVVGGWTAFMPSWQTRPTAGVGDLTVDASGEGARLASGRARVAFAGLGSPLVSFPRLFGDFRLAHEGGSWHLLGRDLDIDPGRAGAWRGGSFDLELARDDAGLAKLRVRAPQVRLDVFGPLATLLPDGTLREALQSFSPRGTLADVDLALARGEGPMEWRVDGGARFTALAFSAWRRVPGLIGLDGELQGKGASGRLAVRSKGFTLELPEYLAGPVSAREASATLDWWWRPDGWRFAIDDAHAIAPDGHGGGIARLWIPSSDESPRLVLDLALADIEVRGASKYLPATKIPPRSMEWLRSAFLAGRIPHARLEYAGDMRRYPFRDGGGLWRVRARYEGLRLHYQDGWADLVDASGDAEFRNEGFSGTLARGRLAGLTVDEGRVRIADFHDARVLVEGKAHGDAKDGLAYLKSSPVGPALGDYFMRVTGQGPFTAETSLDLPLRQFATRVVEVRGELGGVSGRLPNVLEDVRDLRGSFRLRNREFTATDLTGTAYGGPFRAQASTVEGRRGERVIVAQAQGRAAAARVQPQIGITQGSWLDGQADWRAELRLPRLEWQPEPTAPPADAGPDVEPLIAEPKLRWLPGTARLDSTLAGVVLGFPAPLAKPAEAARPLHIDFAIDPGVDADAPVPPAALRAREPARQASVIARIQLGRDAAIAEWRSADAWKLGRGTVRFGGGMPTLRDAPGVYVEGRLPEFDLSAWLRVRIAPTPAPDAPAGDGLGAWLRGGAVDVDRFVVFGYAFPAVNLALESRDRAWRAQVSGASAAGTLVVPWDLGGRTPLVMDMDHLTVGPRARGAAAGGDDPTDPTTLPSMRLAVRALEIEGRRFGALEATLTHTNDGLVLEKGTLKGASFDVSGSGAWLRAPGGSLTRVSVDATSSDVQDTLSAMGFAPTLTAKSGKASGQFQWPGPPDADMFARLSGKVSLAVENGQLTNVQPGAGRVLGLMSVGALPRRLTLDFSDLTEKGFAYDTITGDFEFRDGSAYTSNLLLKGPAAEIGIVGRTGLVSRDYDQTAIVTGHFGGPIAAAGALAAGPAVGAALLLFSKVFKEPLAGMARGYYRITGSWDKPRVERIGAGEARDAEATGPLASGATTP